MSLLVSEEADRLDSRLTAEARAVRWRSADRAGVIIWCESLADRLEVLLRELVLPFDFTVGWRFASEVTEVGARRIPVRLVGEMDLVVRGEGWTDVLDLKATAHAEYWRHTSGQLVFYDTALWVMTGSPTRRAMLVQPMCPQSTVLIPITDSDRAVTWSRIENLAETMSRGI